MQVVELPAGEGMPREAAASSLVSSVSVGMHATGPITFALACCYLVRWFKACSNAWTIPCGAEAAEEQQGVERAAGDFIIIRLSCYHAFLQRVPGTGLGYRVGRYGR